MKAWFGLNASLRQLIKDWPALRVGAVAMLDQIGEYVPGIKGWALFSRVGFGRKCCCFHFFLDVMRGGKSAVVRNAWDWMGGDLTVAFELYPLISRIGVDQIPQILWRSFVNSFLLLLHEISA